MFVLETFIQNLILAQIKSSVKLVKDILKRFIIDVGFTSCLISIRLTYWGLIFLRPDRKTPKSYEAYFCEKL